MKECQLLPKVFFTSTKVITPTSSLIQFLILLNLEKYERMSIQKLSEIIGHSQANYVANEANFLIYNPGFNPNKSGTVGLILTNAAEKKDLEPGDEIWLNKDFNPSNSKPTTVTTTMRRVVCLIL